MKTSFLLLLLLPLCFAVLGKRKEVDHGETHFAHDQSGLKIFSHAHEQDDHTQLRHAVTAAKKTAPPHNIQFDTPSRASFRTDCSCSTFIGRDGFGQCKKEDSRYGRSLTCYVNTPSNCNDLLESETNPGKFISAEPCPKVHCGAHYEKSCSLCPNGRGIKYCNGDCRWDHKKEECILNTGSCGVTLCSSTEGCPLVKNKLLTTLHQMNKQFLVSFEFLATQFIGGWQNVIHFTVNGDCCDVGERVPAFWVKNSGQLYPRFAVNGKGDYGILTAKKYSANEWHRVEISQALVENNEYIYKVIIDGVKQIEEENKQPKIFSNVKVYAADPYYNSLKGSIKNMFINTEGTNECEVYVNCGAHYEPSCSLCAKGRGKINCNGDCRWDHKKEECILIPAVDGGWSNWSAYGQCSKSCGGGQQSRTRTCTNPVPQHKGRTCEQQNIGDPKETKDCNLDNCEPACTKLEPPCTKMPNIGKLFGGYNIMKGSPLPVGILEDPGFRLPIFKASYRSGSVTADDHYLQPDGTKVSDCTGACSLSFGTTEISGSKSYLESLERKVELSGGASGVVWGGKFSASVGYKEVAEKTSSASTLFTLSSASCCAYSVEFLKYQLPSLSQHFRDAVETLTEKYDERIYLNFINEFGTHYIKKVLMGALYGQQSEISKEAWTNMQKNGIDIGTGAELSAYGATVSGHFSNSVNEKTAKTFSSKTENQKTFTIGVKPPADGKKGTWVEKTISNPAPIELDLGGSLLDLFVYHDDIKSKVTTAVKANLEKALDEYCGLLLKFGEAKTCSSPGADPAIPIADPVFDGYCLTSQNQDQNRGIYSLKTAYDKENCYDQCKAVPQATGCEWSDKCAYHVLDVARGNGNPNYKCWVFKTVQWSGIQTKIWGDDECKNVGSFAKWRLEDCKNKCLETAACTAINYSKKNCVLRGCTQPVQAPQLQYGDYRGYYVLHQKT